MNKSMKVVLGGLFLIGQATIGWTLPAPIPLTVTAVIPAATGVSLTVTPVNATTGVFGTSTVNGPINFGNLNYNSTLGIYTATNYYAVDINATGGAGTPTVQVTYADQLNPNNVATNGLGTKATATFVTTSGSGSSTTDAQTSLGKKRLVDLVGSVGTLTSIPSGSWERVYLGIWTGSTTAPSDPTNGKPFTNTDVGGTYTGTLTFTTTAL